MKIEGNLRTLIAYIPMMLISVSGALLPLQWPRTSLLVTCLAGLGLLFLIIEREKRSMAYALAFTFAGLWGLAFVSEDLVSPTFSGEPRLHSVRRLAVAGSVHTALLLGGLGYWLRRRHVSSSQARVRQGE